MRRTLILLMLGGVCLAAGTPAMAGDHCDRPMRDWRPRQAVEERARELGVEVNRIRTDDGCYRIYGRTADGRSVEIEMDPLTLNVLETEFGDRARRRDHDRPEPYRTAPPGRPAAPAIR
ncbi:PepSY domain-containing protein [Brevundimonas sp.]|uniref:PepSY domain-containing protein n=2 Tax=Brevundimonas sp. TaxID=1871086 RepID=UPI00351D74F5